MAEVFHSYEERVAQDERDFVARACGREADDGRWEGWLEFLPADGTPVLRTERETVQPNRTDLEYWSGGLGRAYLEGALRRALEPREPVRRPPEGEPAYSGPAPSPARPNGPVLDPFELHEKYGAARLRDRLRALDPPHLAAIARGYRLVDERSADLERLSADELVERIVAAVEAGGEAERPVPAGTA